MFSVTFDELLLRLNQENEYTAKIPSTNTIKMTRRNIEMFLYQFFNENEFLGIHKNNLPELNFEHFFKSLSILDDHLDSLIVQMTEDYFNSVFRRQTGNKTVKNTNELKQTRLVSKRKFNNTFNQLNFSHCLFNWYLPTSNNNKDMISHIMKKSSNYLLNISIPIFMFERYISNIIISYELFNKGNKETARLVLLSIGKWLNKLDERNDEFYLSISDGLKHVLISTLIRMNSNSFNRKNQWLFSIIVPFSDLNCQSKAAVNAIHAAVLIEYGNKEDHFLKAIECVNKAFELNPTNYYWSYLNSLVLTAQRFFLQTNKSNPTENEKNAMQQAIELCDNDQNIYVKYREVELFKDEVFYNFHTNKNKKDSYNIYMCECKQIVKMIKIIISMNTNDPLILINCARILMSLPAVVNDLNAGKELLIKVLQMAPNDLTVLKAVTQVIILCKRNIKNKNTTQNSSCDKLSMTNKQVNCFEDLKIAQEKHNKGEDPVPYLKSLLFTYNCQTRWKIVAQICSYTVLFSDDLKTGVEYFMLLVDADQNEMINKDLILCHYSSFIRKAKKFNLAELISNEILIALVHNTLLDKQYYYNVLAKVLLLYGIDMTGKVDTSLRCTLISEQSIKNIQPQQNNFENNDKRSESDCVNHNSNKRSKSRSRSRQRQRKNKTENNQNNTNANCYNIDDIEDNNIENNDDVSISSSDTNSYKCCACRIM